MAFQREKQRISATEVLEEILKDQEILLSRCVISGSLDLNRLFVEGEQFDTSGLKIVQQGSTVVVRIDKPVTFNDCVFEDDVVFAPPWENPEELSVIFSSDVHFNSSTFHGQARFTNARYEGNASYDGCTFSRVCCFRNTVFSKMAMMRTVGFEGYVLFTEAVFSHEARFTNTSFAKGGNFTHVQFLGRTDFSGVYSRSKSVPVYDSVRFARKSYGDDETFWRFIKQASQEGGYYQLAGESFYRERCAHLWKRFRGVNYERLSPAGRFWRAVSGVGLLPELVFGKMLFGYGERPIRVLIASALIIIVCGLFFSSPYARISYGSEVQTGGLTLLEGLYFSTITFTTLGFGDLYPTRGHGLTTSVAMVEALSGACLMALFVVSLSKRYSRG